jgi:hypothetical protein
MSIDDDLDGCDARRREENFPLNDRAIGLFLDGLSSDMMMVVVEDSWRFSRSVCEKQRERQYPTDDIQVYNSSSTTPSHYLLLLPYLSVTPF